MDKIGKYLPWVVGGIVALVVVWWYSKNAEASSDPSGGYTSSTVTPDNSAAVNASASLESARLQTLSQGFSDVLSFEAAQSNNAATLRQSEITLQGRLNDNATSLALTTNQNNAQLALTKNNNKTAVKNSAIGAIASLGFLALAFCYHDTAAARREVDGEATPFDLHMRARGAGA